MKMNIAIAMTIGALFVAVPSATPKGSKPAGLTFSVACNAQDSCTLTGSGFAPNTSYGLSITDSCGGPQTTGTSVNANATGAINTTINGIGEGGCPGNTGWTFTLSTLGKRSSTVATFTATDNGTAP